MFGRQPVRGVWCLGGRGEPKSFESCSDTVARKLRSLRAGRDHDVVIGGSRPEWYMAYTRHVENMSHSSDSVWVRRSSIVHFVLSFRLTGHAYHPKYSGGILPYANDKHDERGSETLVPACPLVSFESNGGWHTREEEDDLATRVVLALPVAAGGKVEMGADKG